MTEVKSEGGTKQKAPCGTWISPISAESVAQGALKLSQPMYGADGITLYWLEGRPQEGGRQVVVTASGDITPAPFNVRSAVHEYGGGAYTVAHEPSRSADQVGAAVAASHDSVVYFSHFQDQRLWRQKPGEAPEPVSAEGNYRFADYAPDLRRNRLLVVMEDHRRPGREPANVIAAVALEGGEPQVLVSGHDFYGSPRLSPDGRHLAYLAWDHPNMPWDGCALMLADLDETGLIGRTRRVAGGADSCIFQPQWSPGGKLFFISEESGFWQPAMVADLHSEPSSPTSPTSPSLPSSSISPTSPTSPSSSTECRANEDNFVIERLISDGPYGDCEFGLPMWVFGQSTYAFVDESTVVFAFNRKGLWQLGRLHLNCDSQGGGHRFELLASPYTEISYLCGGAGRVAMLAGSASLPLSVVELLLTGQDVSFKVVKAAVSKLPPQTYLTAPQVIEFPAPAPFEGESAYAFYYPPLNAEFEPGPGEAPPLLVKCHGGPTGAASSLFSLGIQYWTSRGFAVVDVNYGGSTGFGRDYRRRLRGNWGVVDVADCCACAEYLAHKGLADGSRLAISGGSAGGYTVLSALTFTDTFSAGASHYGIGDLEALARDTHKFESRYEDNLVAPYPSGLELYRKRSPINHVERLNCPVIFFQGSEDKVVPPNQAEAMVEALRKKGIAVAYIVYEGEQHGFRRAENIVRTIESEYYFFCKIFNIELANHGAVVAIENLEQAGKTR